MKIAILDYGLGNLRSVYNAFKFLGESPKITQSPEDLKRVEKIVLPGVGSFGDAVLGLKKRGLDEALRSEISSGKPYLGMCLGLQILFEESEESKEKGLGILKGKVKRFNEKDGVKVPQIGWNTVISKSGAKLLEGIEKEPYFYFVHSYYGVPKDKSIIAGTTDYGVTFASMIEKDNINAVQFHPERSQEIGLLVLKNFIKF